MQAADVFTTTPQIVTDKLVSLADPKFNFAAQNVIPLVYKPAMNATIINTLNAVDAKLTTDALLQMDNAVITRARELHHRRGRLPAGGRAELTGVATGPFRIMN